MKRTFVAILLWFSAFSIGVAQEMPSTVNLVRSGLGYMHQGTGGFSSTGASTYSRSIGILMPAYVRLDSNRLYLAAPLPTLRWQEGEGSSDFAVGVNPAAGYIFSKPGSRYRLFFAGVLNLGFSIYDYHYRYYDAQGQLVGSTSNQGWTTSASVELRLGAYRRISERIWMDLTIDAPTGHSLYRARVGDGLGLRVGAYNNIYYTYLPKVQLGVSYQIR